MRIRCLLYYLFLSLRAAGQDDSLVLKMGLASPQCCSLDSSRHFSVVYANDVFVGTDRYFTQGVYVSVRHPSLRLLDVAGMLTPMRGNHRQYNLTASLLAYTPSSIASDSILRRDRPYSGVFLLTASGNSNRVNARWSMSGALSIGIIGPAAQGREVQVFIHRATDNFIPLGWQHQVRNDLLLNYHLRVDYALLRTPHFSITPSSHIKVGTLEDRINVSVEAALSSNRSPDRRVSRLVLLGWLSGEAVGYDARLQGGLLNRSSPYVLSSAEISRFVGRGGVTLHARIRGVAAGVGYQAVTREFRTGLSHAWGIVYAGFDF